MNMISIANIHDAVTEIPRILIYGTQGVGKTFLASGAPHPIFLQTEQGAGRLKLKTFGLLRTFDEIMAALGELYHHDHPFQTLVVDALDVLEPIIHAETMRVHGWKGDLDSAAGGYGKGYDAANKVWRKFLQALDAISAHKRMGVVLLAHNEIRQFKDPDTEAYDRYQISLKKTSSAVVQQWLDEVWFLNWRIAVVTDGASSRGKGGRARALGSGVRVVHTQKRPAYEAKSRFGLPEEIDLPNTGHAGQAWGTVARFIPYYQPQE